jgi:hypothetical protein
MPARSTCDREDTMTAPAYAALAQQCAQLATELAELRARETVRERVYAACRALDRLDRELLREQFHADATLDYGSIYRGSIDGFVDVAMGFQGAMRDTQHLVGNVLVSVRGDTATAESYVHAHHVIVQDDGERVQLMIGGRYLDRFSRRDGEWKISFRTELIDWGRWLPMQDRWFEENRELPKGRHDAGDLSGRFIADDA